MSYFKDKTPQYEISTLMKIDAVFSDMANEIMASAVRKAPLSATKAQKGKFYRGESITSGSLRASIRYERLGVAKYKIIAGGGTRNVDYAGYQERGMMKDGTRVVKRYTTPGTGKRYMEDSASMVANKFSNKIRSILR